MSIKFPSIKGLIVSGLVGAVMGISLARAPLHSVETTVTWKHLYKTPICNGNICYERGNNEAPQKGKRDTEFYVISTAIPEPCKKGVWVGMEGMCSGEYGRAFLIKGTDEELHALDDRTGVGSKVKIRFPLLAYKNSIGQTEVDAQYVTPQF